MQSKKPFVCVFSVLFMLVLSISTLDLTPAHAAGISYSSPGGTGDCSSWANACTLQEALTRAASGDEIWAAAGVYKPTANGTDRSATFQLINDVALYGGFEGTETTRDQRDPKTHLTILSGDVDNNDSQTPIITNLTTVTGNTTNSYHVVTAINSSGAVLDGFSITAGYANQSSDIFFGGDGGGMLIKDGNPALTNLILSGNYANTAGGGISINNYSSPTLTNVTFNGNYADHVGGGMHDDSYSSPTLVNLTFSGNSSYYNGGGIRNDSSSLSLTKVTFSGNSSGDGGGIYNYGTNMTLTNVTFSGNNAYRGGGVFNFGGNPTLTNVTFAGNSASFGGGMENFSAGSPLIRNAIFWGNSATAVGNSDSSQIGNNDISSALLSNSVVQGGCHTGSICVNLITTDPLLGPLGNHGGYTQTIPLLPGSSAIDTGNDALCSPTDQRGVTRPQGPHCDIGAYEATIPPVVTSITRLNPNPTYLSSVGFTVTFSEPVTGVAVSDFALTTTGVTGATVSGVSGSGSAYTVSVNTGKGAGAIRLDVVDHDTIVNVTLDPLGGVGAGNGNYTHGETYDVRFYHVYLASITQ